MKRKKNQNLDTLIEQTKAKREVLPLTKMDDVSRRQFIQSVGTFLGVMSVPTFIRLDTMSKISKKLFGNSMAFAQSSNPDAGPMRIVTDIRAGFGASWGPATYAVATNPLANRSWAASTLTTATGPSGVPTVFNPHGDMFRTGGYAGSIAFNGAINSESNHTQYFLNSYKAGLGELHSMAAKTYHDQGTAAITKAPPGFYNKDVFGIQEVPEEFSEYVPTEFHSIGEVLNLFTAPTFKTNKNKTISAAMMARITAAQQAGFEKLMDNSLLQKDKGVFNAANAQANSVLTKNLRQVMDLDDPSNSAIKAALTSGVPTIPTRPGSNQKFSNVFGNQGFVDPVYVWFAAIQGFIYGGFVPLCYNGYDTSDWHSVFTPPPGAGSDMTDPRTLCGAYISKVMFNFVEAANAGMFKNPVTGQNQILDFCLRGGEFSRGPHCFSNDNPDGIDDAYMWLTSEKNTSRFLTGSFGGSNASSQMYGFNPTTKVNSTSIAMWANEKAFGQYAKFLGVDPSDFGITSPPIAGL